jgi:signal transduction histidine kinase
VAPVPTNPISRLVRRLMPDALGARLVLTGVLLALATSLTTVAIDGVLFTAHVDVWARALVAGIAVIFIATALGLWLSRLMRNPVRRMVEHVKTQGYLAAEGAPYSGEDLVDDPALPLEFRELGAVVEDLLRHLAARQSELKSAVRKAGYAEETLGVVVNESVEAKIVLQDGRVVIANPAASVALGLPQSALLERTASEAFAETTVRREDGSQAEPHALLESALEGPATVSLARDEHPDRWYVVQAVRHADDLHNRILVSARDVTEERRLQSIRADIVSLVSHDLRSPLAVVIGYLDLLHKPLPDEDRDRAIDSAKKNAARMADLLEDLLSATRAEELLAPAELVPVSVVALAEEIVSSMRETHPDQQFSLVSDRSPVVLGDEKRLRQAVLNLVTNAYKYASPSSPVEVVVAAQDDHATIRVVDHGPGIPADERSRVFERFARLDSGGWRPGVGLGLYIVQTIARNHGGSARVEETPGGGATFIIDLPLAGETLDGEIVLHQVR